MALTSKQLDRRRSTARGTSHRAAWLRRWGVTAVEVLLALPVLVIFCAASLEFGVILANLKYLPMSSRIGAKLLAETPRTSLNSRLTLESVKQAVDDALSSGDVVSCCVILEHNVDGISLQQTGDCECPPPAGMALPADGAGAVRVTVCVQLSQLTPDLLSIFGFSTAGRLVRASTTYPYEDP